MTTSNPPAKTKRTKQMDRFEKFLESVIHTDPVMETVKGMYSRMKQGDFFKPVSVTPPQPLLVPDSVRSVTVDPRSGLANKLVTPSIDAMGAPTSHCTSSMASTKGNTRTEAMPETETKHLKPQQIRTQPNKQIKGLIDKAKAHLPNPVQFTKTYSEQVPVCGYSVKTGSTSLTGSYVQGTDAGYSTGGAGSTGGASAD